MAKASRAQGSKTKTADGNKVGFPNVKPSALSERNLPKPPATLRVNGNVIPVINGKAAESDPRKLRRRAIEKAKRRGGDIDETRI